MKSITNLLYQSTAIRQYHLYLVQRYLGRINFGSASYACDHCTHCSFMLQIVDLSLLLVCVKG